ITFAHLLANTKNLHFPHGIKSKNKDKDEWLLVIFYLGAIRPLAVAGFLKDAPTINFSIKIWHVKAIK
ncbi:hypothetical protein QIG77_25315, partial [Klebsiella pneumoniae]|nr:hypothetical protein [Klebsiella pneumoniae]